MGRENSEKDYLPVCLGLQALTQFVGAKNLTLEDIDWFPYNFGFPMLLLRKIDTGISEQSGKIICYINAGM